VTRFGLESREVESRWKTRFSVPFRPTPKSTRPPVWDTSSFPAESRCCHPPPSAGLRSGWLYTPVTPLCVRSYVMGWPLLFSHLLCDYRQTGARYMKKKNFQLPELCANNNNKELRWWTKISGSFQCTSNFNRSTQWRSWLRHYATNWKVAGSISGGVIGIFHWRNSSGRGVCSGVCSGCSVACDTPHCIHCIHQEPNLSCTTPQLF
jgi:hypothetical protein